MDMLVDNSVETKCDVWAEKQRIVLGRERRTDTFGYSTAPHGVTREVNPSRRK